jgi:AcrR family transcriptional regulator
MARRRPPPASARLAALAQTRTRLVEAARDIVAEKGWQGAQVALIAARAKVATGSVYRYFASKADLYAEVLSTVSQREVDVIRTIVDTDAPAAERLENAIQAFVRRAMKARRLAYALLAEPCDPEIDTARLRYRAAFGREIARAIRAGIACGEFADVDEAVAASCVTGAFMEALVGPLAPETKPDSKAADRIASTIAKLCVRMVLKAERAGRASPARTR